MRMPLDVSSFKSNQFITETNVKLANRAPSLVLAQDIVAKCRIPRWLRLLAYLRSMWDTYCITNFVVHRIREMSLKQSVSSLQYHLWAGKQ